MGVEEGAYNEKQSATTTISKLTPGCEDSTNNIGETLKERNQEKFIWGAKRLRTSGTDIQMARVPAVALCPANVGGPSSSGAAETVSAVPEPSSRTLHYQQSTSSLEAYDGKERNHPVLPEEREVKSEDEASVGGLDSTGTIPTAAHLLMSLCKAVPPVDCSIEEKDAEDFQERETAQSPKFCQERTLPLKRSEQEGGENKARNKEKREVVQMINIKNVLHQQKYPDGNEKTIKIESESETQQGEEPKPGGHSRKQNGKSSGYKYRFGPGNSVSMHSTVNGRQKSCAYVGVRKRQWGTYAAEIRNQLTGSREWLGTFDSAEEAAVVYDMRLRQIKGPGAKCNFPPLIMTGHMVKREICPHGKSAPQRLTLMIPEDWLQQVVSLQSGTLKKAKADVCRKEISKVPDTATINESTACAHNNVENLTTTRRNELTGYEIANNEGNS
jgi:hypothetical protein